LKRVVVQLTPSIETQNVFEPIVFPQQFFISVTHYFTQTVYYIYFTTMVVSNLFVLRLQFGKYCYSVQIRTYFVTTPASLKGLSPSGFSFIYVHDIDSINCLMLFVRKRSLAIGILYYSTMVCSQNVVGLIVLVGLLTVNQISGLIIPSVNETTETASVGSASTAGEKLLRMEDQYQCVCTPFHSCKTYTPEANGGELIDIR